jgi:hypothetical protein
MSTEPRRLTLDQRARRAATRKNNQVAQRYPLFPEHFATTVEAEKERLIRQEQQAIAYLERLRRGGLAAWEKGQGLRQVALDLLPAEVVAERDAHFQRWHGHRPQHEVGHYLTDLWWRALRDHAPHWTSQRCPNAYFHPLTWWARDQPCPTCHMPWNERACLERSERACLERSERTANHVPNPED